jgi:hypothetical protein
MKSGALGVEKGNIKEMEKNETAFLQPNPSK